MAASADQPAATGTNPFIAGADLLSPNPAMLGVPPGAKLRLLLVEEVPEDMALVQHALDQAGLHYTLQRVAGEAEFLAALRATPPDLVLSDYTVSGFEGWRALKLLRREHPEIPFIFVSGTVGEEQLVEMLRQGATDFVSKERLAKLGPAVERALREIREQSDLKRAEASLRNSETRFRAVFEGAGTGIAVEDLQGRIIKSNRALQNMLGYSAEELQRLSRQDFTHARDHKEDAQSFNRLLSGQSDHYQAEKRFVRKDGRIFWGRLTVSMVRDAEGRPQFPMAMIDDVTERQRAEEALLQYAAIVESSNDAIVSKTFDGVIFSWNPGAERVYGYTANEANGRSLSIITPPDKEEEFERILERIRCGERIDNFETIRHRKDGTRIDVSITTSPIKDISGRIIGASSISRDVTERKRAEAALRESEENYRRLVELSPDAIFIQSEGKFVYLNSAGVKLFGAASPEQVIGKSIFELLPPQFHERARAHVRELREGESAPLREEKFIRLDGSLLDVEATAIPFVYRGKAAFQMVVRDITERKRAEAALRKSEANLAQAQQLAHLGSWERDLPSEVIAWSDETCRIFGIAPGTFAGTYEAFLERVHPEDRQTVVNAGEQSLRHGAPYNVDHRIVLPNGEIRTVNEQAELVRDEQGKPARFLGTVLDITQRKKAEIRIAALSNLGRRLSSAITAKDAASIVVEIADQLFGWDACILDLCSPDQKTFNTILSIDIIDGQRAHVKPVYVHSPPSSRTRRVLEYGPELILRPEPVASPDFTPFGDVARPSASLMYVPVRNGPKLVGALSIQSYSRNAYTDDDLNTLQALADHCGGALERIRAEAENQKLAAFPQFNPNPVLELAPDGTINYFNEAALQMAVALGRQHPTEILPPNTAAVVADCLASGLSSLRHENLIQQRTLSWSFFPVRTIGVVHCYAVDITDRQNLEAQLRQAQKMESVGQLAGGIAHDFNNILTVIQGHTSLLALGPDLSKDAAESAQQISLAAERAANLTRQLLTFSRRQVMQPKSLDLNEVVHNMTKMLRRLLGEDITLHVSYASNLPLIQVDPGMMEQVILNLAINARDAMPRGGRLLLSTCVANIDAGYGTRIPEARPGQHVRLLVKDTGIGIAPENLTRIFEPFFTTKDVGKGTGLGLATVYGIVQQHRGWIEVSSTVGKETAFEIFLPAAGPKTEVVEVKTPELKVRGGNETILVVEDEAPLRILVRNVLERYGYRVLEAESGLAALGIWIEHKHHIHLVLTDMVMPHGMSGRELAQRLRQEKPDTKVIFSSGYSLAVVGNDMVLREGLNFLQKPYHPRKLAQAIRDCLDGP